MIPVISSPTRSWYSSNIIIRSASRIRCRITCLAVWAAIRPKSSGVTSRVLDLVLVGGDHLGVELGLLRLAQLARFGVDLALLLLLGLGRLGQQLLLQLGRQDQLEDAEVAGFVVEVDAGVFGGAGRLLVGGEERVGERVHQLVGGDPLLLLERLDCVDDLFAHWMLLGFGNWICAAVLRARRGDLERVVGQQVVEVLRHPFAERQIDPLGVVDEEPQRFVAGLLDGDEIELGVELGQLLLDVVLGGRSCLVRGEKKVGQAHFWILLGQKSLSSV